MITVAATLMKDVLGNARRFVGGNLAHGIDHLVVVADGTLDSDAFDYLDAHDRVTLVVADQSWWGADFIETLNGRQRVAANVARVACLGVPEIDWLFFLDGDEVAVLDRDALARVPPESLAVRLSPLEAVATSDGRSTDLFKRLLSKPELRQLRRLGILERANNARYFRGHVSGKVGIRPRAEVRLDVHSASDDQGNKLEAYVDPGLRHLHFESPTYEEFVRKWSALAESGPPPGMRDRRALILQAFIDARAHGDPRESESTMRELYATHVLEDAACLEALGLLERIQVVGPVPDPPAGLAQVVARLEREIRAAQDVPKRQFLPKAPD